MNLQTLLHKCASTPGVQVSEEDHSVKLQLETSDGSGTMTFYPIFPGITLAYISVHAACWPAPDVVPSLSITAFPDDAS